MLSTCLSLQGSHISGLTKFHDISMIFPGFSKKFQVYFLNIFNVASNYFWINVYIKISPNQKYIICTVSQGSHISGLTKFHDISRIFIIFLQNSMIFPGVLYFSRFSSKCGKTGLMFGGDGGAIPNPQPSYLSKHGSNGTKVAVAAFST